VDETTYTVFFANTGGDNTVDVVNGDTFAVTATIAVGNSPVRVALNPLTHLVYVANGLDQTISVIDETTNTVPVTISISDHPQGIVGNPATNVLYVAMDQSVGVGTWRPMRLNSSLIPSHDGTVNACPECRGRRFAFNSKEQPDHDHRRRTEDP
jgi:YVTN family beta-propeller protein